MQRSDERPRRPGQEASRHADPSGKPDDKADAAISKTRRKHAMLALQDLGETLTELKPERLAALALPERLAEAIATARKLTRHEARRRQMQFVGRLMRDIDPLPIEAQLASWAVAPNAEKAHLAAVERWRARLLEEADALDQLCLLSPGADRGRLAALVVRAAEERRQGSPLHAYRELFRELNRLLSTGL
jgi:ribosome-associated protein